MLTRDIAIIELLFATGLRISELCGLEKDRFNISDGILCIRGKGAKERYLQIGSATLLLEEDVDIRYIQKMLGHSSIVTTQIYMEVACKKQMEILKTKHPRNWMRVGK